MAPTPTVHMLAERLRFLREHYRSLQAQRLDRRTRQREACPPAARACDRPAPPMPRTVRARDAGDGGWPACRAVNPKPRQISRPRPNGYGHGLKYRQSRTDMTDHATLEENTTILQTILFSFDGTKIFPPRFYCLATSDLSEPRQLARRLNASMSAAAAASLLSVTDAIATGHACCSERSELPAAQPGPRGRLAARTET
jgi:hypothetical protein